MKTAILSVIVCLIIGVLSQGCEKKNGDTYPINDKLILIPENPTSQDEIKIIEKEVCKYDLLSIVRTANMIEYTRRFNSMIMAPCLILTDTVSLGHLQAGNYILFYTLIDNAIQTNDSIVETSKFSFTVAEK